MTLKITRYFADAFNKQASIAHFPFKIQFGTPEKVKAELKDKIAEQFGELFLEDANYIIVCPCEDNPDLQKYITKFHNLIKTVLHMDVDKSEIKVLKLAEPAEDDDMDDTDEETPEEEMDAAIKGEAEADMGSAGGPAALIVKITTK